ncbi:hypothetical protein FQN57_003049 [Myotisia sp. PD_48]|nr:hypothetical protein FQN57_003049 [Myotisia sp. PD_48]
MALSELAASGSQFYSHRFRRGALIPNDVKLTPEEEKMVIRRIGYLPLLPTNPLTSNWAHKTSDCADRKDITDWDNKYKCGSVETAHSEIFKHIEETFTPWGKRDYWHTKTECRDRSPKYRVRQPSWSVDIPHMSEIQPLNDENNIEGMPLYQQRRSLYRDDPIASPSCTRQTGGTVNER